MLNLINNTHFKAEIHSALDHHCHDYLIVVIKGAYKITPLQPLQLMEGEATIFHQDKHFGDAQSTGIEHASDIVRIKHRTDVVVNGTAYAPHTDCTTMDVGVQIDHWRLTRRIFGDRCWLPSLMDWKISAPRRFETIPLTIENAFGGTYKDSERKLIDAFAYNPIGKGYVSAYAGEPYEGQPLPNIENPQALIKYWKETPSPAGMGFIANTWQPRLTYQGTYDEAWLNNRAPLLPSDFDERFFNAAPSDLQLPFLRGGEQISLNHLTPNGTLSFTLPAWRLKISIIAKGKAIDIIPVMDTIVIEPDKLEVQLTWRASVMCQNQLLYIEKIIVREI